MMRKPEQNDMPVVAGPKKRAPVRVKLKRIDCNRAKPYPPDGMKQEWWQRLKDALGTCSSDFGVNTAECDGETLNRRD